MRHRHPHSRMLRDLLVVVTVVLVSGSVLLLLRLPAASGHAPTAPLEYAPTPSSLPPPRGGYFRLQPVGSYARLPDDATAAAEVHRSTWEPTPGNTKYNHVMPTHLRMKPASAASLAYDPRWNTYILRRITGHFTGTTDEIFQWASAKWGLSDNLLRAIAYAESTWRQTNFGDDAWDRALCPPGYRDMHPCPITFGIVGIKSPDWPGIFPWNRDSTAAAVDVLGGWLRGCYEGWGWWLRNAGNRSHVPYHAGDIWGCVGAWYSGEWYDGSPTTSSTGEHYIAQVQLRLRQRAWLLPGF